MGCFEYCGVSANCRYVSTLADSEVGDPRLVCPSVGPFPESGLDEALGSGAYLLLLESMFATKPPAYPDAGGADCWRSAARPVPWALRD